MTKLAVKVYKTIWEEEDKPFRRTKSDFLRWILEKQGKPGYSERLSRIDLEIILNEVLRMLATPVGQNYRVANKRKVIQELSVIKEENDNTLLFELMEDLVEILNDFRGGEFLYSIK